MSVFSAQSLTLTLFVAVSLHAEEVSKKFYSDDPVWTSPQPTPATQVGKRKLSDYYDFFSNTFFPVGERAPGAGRVLPAQAINTVDEAPDSAWYTNRHASRTMSLRELKAGPGDANAPASGKLTVIAAKNEGVTPGFRVRDAMGRVYLLKFDPLSNPELASAADVITSKFFYALGYNVPENYVVYFDRKQIVVGANAEMKNAQGHKRQIRQSDIDEMLTKAPRGADGKYRAMASLLIDGKAIGPFQYHGTRGDDPNDLIDHELRRDLRGLRTLCAWLGHDDSRAINSLDVLTQSEGIPFVKHYLIDFGASLGSASFRANSPRDGNVYLFDWKSSAAQVFTLGLYAPKWQHAKYPPISSVGRFEYEVFDPLHWVGDYPNAAFRNESPADRAWAARKIQTFSGEQIRAIVSTGQYTDPDAEEWVARCLIERRKKIIDAVLTGTDRLDRFVVRDGRLHFSHLGAGAKEPALKVQWSAFDNSTGARRVLAGSMSLDLPKMISPIRYLVAEITAAHGPAISVYIRTDSESVVGVERHYGRSHS